MVFCKSSFSDELPLRKCVDDKIRSEASEAMENHEKCVPTGLAGGVHKTSVTTLNNLHNLIKHQRDEQCWDIGGGEGYLAAYFNKITGKPVIMNDVGTLARNNYYFYLNDMMIILLI